MPSGNSGSGNGRSGTGRSWSRRALLTGGGAAAAALLAPSCTSMKFLAANLPATFGAYRRRTDIAYGSLPQQRLDLYLPEKPRTRPPPLIVFWHGGRWSTGDKADYRFVGAALAEIGCASVLPNYRHYPEVMMDGFMHDAAAAALWAGAQAPNLGADPGRLYLMGHSAGAYLAAMLSLNPRYWSGAGGGAPRIAGMIGLSGPYDFLPLLEPDVQQMFGPPERYPESQPINFVRPGAPPMLLVHGLRDEDVWPKNSRNLATALAAQGVAATLKLYSDCTHADTVAALSAVARTRAPTLADVAAFIGASDAQAA